MPTLVQRLMRQKYVQFDHSELPRVLGVIDLTALGIGSTIGVGIYVLAGQVSREMAGPAVTVSFLIAAVASLFAGLCYAEFGARVPKAGSAYIYTYVCVGEFVAFFIGWNLILEYIIGAASVASGFSLYVDALANSTISTSLEEAMPIDVPFLASYPDFLAFALAFTISLLLAAGVKDSARLNSIFTIINMVVIFFVVISAGTQADGYNWAIPESKLNETCLDAPPEGRDDWGTGGFAPFGFDGIMRGAATCFFGFVGFDVIATTGEETINPSRTIPLSIGLSLLFVFISYFGLSAVLTLALPYCQQDSEAPLVYLYEDLGWDVAKWFVSIGALFGFSASLFGSLFPLPRVIYAMASDGLVFRFLSRVNKRFKTPALATIISGLFAGFMAMIFDLETLVDMMSIGTLMAYTIVAVCVMLLRYADDEDAEFRNMSQKAADKDSLYSYRDYVRQLFNTRRLSDPTGLTASLVSYATLTFCVMVTLVAMLLVLLQNDLAAGNAGAIIAVVITSALTLLNVVIIFLQPQSKRKLSFKVPFVPWIPALSSFFNMYLMCNLSTETWIRFGVWMALGFVVYFCYGIWKSTGDQPPTAMNGVDNSAFKGGSALIIPTIEIHPATPANSEPNTPKTVVKERQAVPPSPLVKVDLHSEEEGSIGIATEVKTSQDVTVQKENGPTNLGELATSEDANGGESTESSGKSSGDNSAILAALLVASSAAEKSSSESSMQDDKEIHKTNKTGPENMSLYKREENVLNSTPDDSSVEPGSVSVDKAMASLIQDKKQENPDSFTDTHSIEGKEEELTSVALVTNIAADLSQSSRNNEEPTMDSSDKKSLENSEAEPGSHETDGTKNDKIREEVHILHYSQSVPALSQVNNSYGSVPSTPVSKRHPHKLRRMSSFDEIPPSSPDSPFARHIKKFTIIPVQEMKGGVGISDNTLDSDVDSAPLTPHSGIVSLPDSDNPKQLMNELLSKLSTNQPDTVLQEQDCLKKDKVIFTVDSAESLTDGEARFMASDQLSSRDFKRANSRESRLEVLDTIKERGESKIIHSDEGFLGTPSVLDNLEAERKLSEHEKNENSKGSASIVSHATNTSELSKEKVSQKEEGRDLRAQENTPSTIADVNGQLNDTSKSPSQETSTPNKNVE